MNPETRDKTSSRVTVRLGWVSKKWQRRLGTCRKETPANILWNRARGQSTVATVHWGKREKKRESHRAGVSVGLQGEEGNKTPY